MEQGHQSPSTTTAFVDRERTGGSCKFSLEDRWVPGSFPVEYSRMLSINMVLSFEVDDGKVFACSRWSKSAEMSG
jgi:hypothetical protein